MISYSRLLYKVRCFIGISGTDKTDNLTCEIIYDNFACENYRFSVLVDKTVVYIINKKIYAWKYHIYLF